MLTPFSQILFYFSRFKANVFMSFIVTYILINAIVVKKILSVDKCCYNFMVKYQLFSVLKNLNTLKFNKFTLIFKYCNKCTKISFDFSKLFLILKNLSFLKYVVFLDLVVLDTLSFSSIVKRFLIVYILLSLRLKIRLLIKIDFDACFSLKTISGTFASAVWPEREGFDMFGIVFKGNNDLRRILNDYGFEGFPGQKNFPVYGFKELFYRLEVETVFYTNCFFSQRYRNFYFPLVWKNKPSRKSGGTLRAVEKFGTSLLG